MVNAQQYLDQNYPTASRSNFTELDLSNKNLEGDLVVSGFTNLRKFNVSFNKITSFNLYLPAIEEYDNSHNLLAYNHQFTSTTLQKLNFSFNYITSYYLNTPSLIHLDTSSNLLTTLDTSSSSVLIELNCSNNPINLLSLNSSISSLTSFDCMSIKFSKTNNIQILKQDITPITTTPASSITTPLPSSTALYPNFSTNNAVTSVNNLNLILGLGIPLAICILGWIAIGVIFCYRHKFYKNVLKIPGNI